MTKSVFVRKKEILAGMFLCAMTIGNAVMFKDLLPLLRSGYQNFTIFYTAGKMVRDGQTANMYNLSDQYQVQRKFAPDVRTRQAALPYNHPPFEALLFAPLTWFSYWKAYLIWTALNLGILSGTLFVLKERFPRIGNLSPLFIAVAALGFYPVATSLVQGQDCILLLFCVVCAMAAFEKNWDIVAGVFLAAGLFRFQLVLPLVLLLAIRRWRLLLGFGPVAALLGFISLAMVGWTGATGYVRFVLSLERNGAGGSIVAAGMPNLRGMIAGLPALGDNPTTVLVLTLACSVLLILIAVWQIQGEEGSGNFAFTLATLTAILVSYHALTYDLSLLLPSILLLFSQTSRGTDIEARGDIVLLLILFVIPRFGFIAPVPALLVWFGAFLLWLCWKRNSARQADI